MDPDIFFSKDGTVSGFRYLSSRKKIPDPLPCYNAFHLDDNQIFVSEEAGESPLVEPDTPSARIFLKHSTSPTVLPWSPGNEISQSPSKVLEVVIADNDIMICN